LQTKGFSSTASRELQADVIILDFMVHVKFYGLTRKAILATFSVFVRRRNGVSVKLTLAGVRLGRMGEAACPKPYLSLKIFIVIAISHFIPS